MTKLFSNVLGNISTKHCRYQILSGSALKLIACLAMLSDHLAKFLRPRPAWVTAEWFSVFGRVISVHDLMLVFGRFAFPIFVFLLVVGFEKTRNKIRYGVSLLVLALLSEVPYDLMIRNTLHFPYQNVIFTLLLGFLAMWSLSFFKKKPIISLFCVVVLFVVSKYLRGDYGVGGYCFILLMYGLRQEKVIRTVATPLLLPSKMKVFVALLVTLLYNGKRGFIKSPFLKYCFYAFYPVHMLVIYLISNH